MPALLTPADLSTAQWNFLVSAIKAEAGFGSGPPGTTPGNRLSGIKYVGAAYHLWTDQVPAIGVQLKGFREVPKASQRHFVTTTFDILIATQSTAATSGTNKPNLEDAMSQLRAFVTDGTGANGISPVLRDPQYRNLGKTGTQINAQQTQIADITYEWEIEEGQNPQIWAYALITFIAEQIVQTY